MMAGQGATEMPWNNGQLNVAKGFWMWVVFICIYIDLLGGHCYWLVCKRVSRVERVLDLALRSKVEMSIFEYILSTNKQPMPFILHEFKDVE